VTNSYCGEHRRQESDMEKASRESRKGSCGMGSQSQTEKSTRRLMSLDVFRGFIMFWIVGGAAVVIRALELIGDNPVTKLIAQQLKHSNWQGCRFEDLIWPSFMFMVGVSLPFAFAKRAALGQSYGRMFSHTAKRSVVLFLLGSVRASANANQPYLFGLSSARQPIPIAIL